MHRQAHTQTQSTLHRYLVFLCVLSERGDVIEVRGGSAETDSAHPQGLSCHRPAERGTGVSQWVKHHTLYSSLEISPAFPDAWHQSSPSTTEGLIPIHYTLFVHIREYPMVTSCPVLTNHPFTHTGTLNCMLSHATKMHLRVKTLLVSPESNSTCTFIPVESQSGGSTALLALQSKEYIFHFHAHLMNQTFMVFVKLWSAVLFLHWLFCLAWS